MATPLSVVRDVQDALIRYIDTAFWIKDPGIRDERRELLTREGVLLREPLLEPVLPYDGTVPALDACVEASLLPSEAHLLIDALFRCDDPSVFKLRSHQAESLAMALAGGHPWNPVVTAGTGSGKTEAFLLPVLARLLMESRSWTQASDSTQPWWTGNRWEPSRRESRPAAMRTMVLYPMNALVEDQVARLRRALRRIRAAGGPTIWFGRYTSATHGGTKNPVEARNRAHVAQVAQEIRAMQSEFDRLGTLSEADLAQFPDPRVGEMVTRWDMWATPPDIMVTNYSMLNVMLMRQLEQPIFEKTRRWLESDPGHVFTLVVDELHLYRGTQGAEVGMILRNLINRLGLSADSSQLRIIGTSASMDESGGQFLERFFGVPRSTFDIIGGQPRELRPDGSADEQPVDLALALACRDDEGQYRAARLSTVRDRLGWTDERMVEALTSLETPRVGQIPFRTHIFARGIRGLWACSNPECSEILHPRLESGIGRLYTLPREFCECGSRVLALLVCRVCGDCSFAGYRIGSFDGGHYVGATVRFSHQAPRM
ncbi:DEAD/DEAH box helicase [Luteococcus sp.]|uniref:DEAD/DEAH box helicase n=1 Tax=Luteococcus sp. TaxID=1969402 RepID=UPI0037359630